MPTSLVLPRDLHAESMMGKCGTHEQMPKLRLAMEHMLQTGAFSRFPGLNMPSYANEKSKFYVRFIGWVVSKIQLSTTRKTLD